MCKKRTIVEFIKEADEIHLHKYDYEKSIYRGSWVKMQISCPFHGEWSQYPASHLAGHGCPSCRGVQLRLTHAKSLDLFIDEAKAIHGDRYDYSQVKYINIRTKVEIKCKHHGSFFPTPTNHITRQSGCPTCNRRISKGEILVSEVLLENNILFQQQKTFPFLKGKRKHLSCDFWLPQHNIIIEYDGIQHSKPRFISNKKQAADALIDLQHCDKIKDEFALQQGYKMLRIPYTNKSKITIYQVIMNAIGEVQDQQHPSTLELHLPAL